MEIEYEEFNSYDETDIESVVLHGGEEDEDMNAEDAGFMRGFLGMGEV